MVGRHSLKSGQEQPCEKSGRYVDGGGILLRKGGLLVQEGRCNFFWCATLHDHQAWQIWDLYSTGTGMPRNRFLSQVRIFVSFRHLSFEQSLDHLGAR